MGPSRKPHAAPGPEPPPRTKVVVRNLPPGLSRSAFLDAVASAGFAGKDKVRWFDYVQGKAKPKLLVPSVAYADLVDAQTVRAFADAFHGRAFVVEAPTSRGDPNDDGRNVAEAPDSASDPAEAGESTRVASESALPSPPAEPESRTCEAARASRDAAVEYAPIQRVPRAARLMEKTARRRDPMEGTIERDAEYAKFLADLEAGPAPMPSAETLLDRREAAGRSKSSNAERAGARASALLEFLAATSSAWRSERRKGAKPSSKTRDPSKTREAKKSETKRETKRETKAKATANEKKGLAGASGKGKEARDGGKESGNRRETAAVRGAVAPKVLARRSPREPRAEPKKSVAAVKEKEKLKATALPEKSARGRVVFLRSEPANAPSRASGEKKGKGAEPPPAKPREKSKPSGPRSGPGRGGEKRAPAKPRPQPRDSSS